MTPQSRSRFRLCMSLARTHAAEARRSRNKRKRSWNLHRLAYFRSEAKRFLATAE